MCLLCSDENIYRAYMLYMDEMEKRGEQADPDQAMQVAIAIVESEHAKRQAEAAKKNPLNPFICDPIDE